MGIVTSIHILDLETILFYSDSRYAIAYIYYSCLKDGVSIGSCRVTLDKYETLKEKRKVYIVREIPIVEDDDYIDQDTRTNYILNDFILQIISSIDHIGIYFAFTKKIDTKEVSLEEDFSLSLVLKLNSNGLRSIGLNEPTMYFDIDGKRGNDELREVTLPRRIF